MGTSRKMFIGRVTLPPNAGTSLYAMMRDSSQHWGFETTALNDPNFDSIIGSEVIVTPDAPVRVSSDSAAGAAGILKAAAAAFSLSDYGPDFGIIDPTAIYFWNQNGCGMDVIFTAR